MKQKTDVIFGKIKAALSLENPGEILGREKEAKDIKDFVTEAIKDEMGCSLYISGQPGTGKSATINNIIDQINFKKLKTQKGNFFRLFAYVFSNNFMSHNHCNRNIVDISGALFTLNLSILILKSQCEESARDDNNILVIVVI